MAKSKSKSKSSSSKSSKKRSKSKKSKKSSKLDENKNDDIKEKAYITKEIETSITLLESPENGVVLEALLFLSKYADMKRNNLNFIQSRGLLWKLLGLLDHNICIVRVALRLLSLLLTTNAALLQLAEEKCDEAVLKIANFYVTHKDELVKEYAAKVLSSYTRLDRAEMLLQEPELITAILKTIKSPENDVILLSTLELLRKFIEFEQVRSSLPEDVNFDLKTIIHYMNESEALFRTSLEIFEKITYFNDDPIMINARECELVECMFKILLDPEKKTYMLKCLNVVSHCMNNENTRTYFVQSLEFLKYCQWVKTCPIEGMYLCSRIFERLSQIDDIKQMLFDLNVEDTILSLLRSDDKKVLNMTLTAISNMSKHRFCCEKMLTPIVVKKMLEMLQTPGDVDDPHNEIALGTLHNFARRDPRTIHMIVAYGGLNILLNLLEAGTDHMSKQTFRKLLEIFNMLLTNHQLQKHVFCKKLYECIFTQNHSRYDDVCIASLELALNCIGEQDFRNKFLERNHTKFVFGKLKESTNETIIKLLITLIHSGLGFEDLSDNFVHSKLLPLLKHMDASRRERIPLIDRVVEIIYDLCLPMKFFETGRLELMDKIQGLFYVLSGAWKAPFPFLEVLELRQISTKCTIYVVNLQQTCCPELKRLCALFRDDENAENKISEYDLHVKDSIHFGKLSHDPYLISYVVRLRRLLKGVKKIEDRVKILADFVDEQLCGPERNPTMDKMHTFKMHMQCLKMKLGTNMIPIGFLRLGFHCERAILFKTLADQFRVPATLVKGVGNKMYYNEVALLDDKDKVLRIYVVDLMQHVGKLLPLGSKECNVYCQMDT